MKKLINISLLFLSPLILAQQKDPEAQFYYEEKYLGGFGVFLYRLGFFLFPIKLILPIASAFSFVILAFSVSWSIS